MEENKVCNKYIKQLIILFVCVLIAAVYYYGLHLNFLADGEYGAHTLFFFYADRFGVSYPSSRWNFLSQAISLISYKMFGVGYTGLRVVATVKYIVAMIFCIYLSLVSGKEKRIRWYLLPLWFFIAVIINPGMSKECGFNMSTVFHQYPYDMHMESVIFAFMACFALDKMMGEKSRKIKIKWGFLLFVLCLFACKTTDMYFLISFPVPLIIYFITFLWKRNKKIVINGAVCFLGFVVLLRLASLKIDFLKMLFSFGRMDYAQSSIYGAIGFADFETIWSNISHTVVALFALYNVELSGNNILSLRVIPALIRIAIVCLIYFLAVRTIWQSVRKEEDTLDLISVISSYTIILTSGYVMFSQYGAQGRAIRFLLIVLYYGVMLLCRNAERLLERYEKHRDYLRWVLFIGFAFCVLIDVRPAWKDETAEYVGNYEELIDVIKANNLGVGMSDIVHAAPIVELSDGECLAVLEKYTEEDGIEIEGGYDVCIDYIVADISVDMQHMQDKYGEADRVLETKAFRIYCYDDGVDIENR